MTQGTSDAGLLPAAGRVVLISGANRGIGRAIAERLHADGYALSLGARRPRTLADVTGAMDAERVLAHAYDARDRGSAPRWVEATREHFGRIDAVVANAGVIHPFDVEESDESGLDEMWEVNVKGPLRLARAAFAALKESGSGRFVTIASLSGKRVKSAGIAGYAMTKHAALAFTHGLRYAGWEHGLRSTAICPGFVATDMAAGAPLARADMIAPATVAHLVSMVLALPSPASVVEVPVNCVLEAGV